MPTTSSPSRSPVMAANDNGPSSSAQPAVALLTLAEILADVCVARLAAANDNHAPVLDIMEGPL